MKKLLEKYLEMGCFVCVYTINGEELKPHQYAHIELLDDCFIYSSTEEEMTIYPYSSIQKIKIDPSIPY